MIVRIHGQVRVYDCNVFFRLTFWFPNNGALFSSPHVFQSEHYEDKTYW